MNIAQGRILKGTVATIVVTMLFPPFAIYADRGMINGQGFHFVLAEPRAAVIYLPSLVAEWIAIAMICCILWALYRDRPADQIMSLARRIQADPQATGAVEEALQKLSSKRGRPFL